MFWEVLQVELAIFIFIVLCVGIWHLTRYLNWKHHKLERLWDKFTDWYHDQPRGK